MSLSDQAYSLSLRSKFFVEDGHPTSTSTKSDQEVDDPCFDYGTRPRPHVLLEHVHR